MEAVRVLRSEHEGVIAVLDQLERASAAVEQGVPIGTDIFSDAEEFFVVFVDHCHHSKEEQEVFPRLEGGTAGDLVRKLESAHERGRELSRAYAASVRSYSPGDVTSGKRLAAAARAYDGFLREHIADESRDLFPVMEATMSDDDGTMVEAFERIEEEEIGPGTHERLHDMIDELPGRIDAYAREQ